jgi:hypothetical protein
MAVAMAPYGQPRCNNGEPYYHGPRAQQRTRAASPKRCDSLVEAVREKLAWVMQCESEVRIKIMWEAGC